MYTFQKCAINLSGGPIEKRQKLSDLAAPGDL